MKVTFISAGLSRKAGGIFEIERRICQELSNLSNINISVIGLKEPTSQEDCDQWKPLNPVLLPSKGPNSFGYMSDAFKTIESIKPDLLHINALWMYPSFITSRYYRLNRIPYCITINGMLDPWAVKNSKWKKKIAWLFYEYQNLKNAACLIANTQKEYNDIRNLGLNNPVAIIPNGMDFPSYSIRQVKSKVKKMLFLSRIHPKKGIFQLIEAWRIAAMLDWELVIVGWGEKEHVENFAEKCDYVKGVKFIGPKFNQDKKDELCVADAFILPSFSEGLPMAVLEAWAYRLPVLMTAACNLLEGFAQQAAMEITTEPRQLAEQLKQFAQLSDAERQQMGEKGYSLVKEKFAWKQSAVQMKSVYEWVLGGGSPPSCVIID